MVQLVPGIVRNTLLGDATSLGIVAGFHQQYSLAMTKPALCLAQRLSKLVVQRGLIGARWGIALTQPQIHPRCVIVRDKRNQFGASGQGSERSRSRKSQHRIDLIWRPTSEHNYKHR